MSGKTCKYCGVAMERNQWQCANAMCLKKVTTAPKTSRMEHHA